MSEKEGQENATKVGQNRAFLAKMDSPTSKEIFSKTSSHIIFSRPAKSLAGQITVCLFTLLLVNVSNGQQPASGQQIPFGPPFPAPGLPAPFQQTFQPGGSQRSEMLISFEQTPQLPGNPTAALASSQLMKLCSCTCQTMAPAVVPLPPAPTLPPAPSSQPTEPPLTGPIETVAPTETEPPTTTTEPPPPPPPPTTTTTTTTTEPPTTTSTPEPPTEPPTTAPLPVPTTTSPPPPPPPPPTTTTEAMTEQTTAAPPATTSHPPNTVNACNSVEWVKPNMSVYSSSKVVWDVDRANQNYFLCNNLVDGELVPGKTHGFSCKVSSQGKALEVHNFNVLIKPEAVNLAWVQKDSDSFGKTNLPVIGGYSKDNQEPYIISRCLVGDENNDVITLIGYVNNQGVGWFPFDDIQIECPQYDVLVCVNKY